MPTKAELKQAAQHIKLKIRKGDKVQIIAGKDKGEIGTVIAVSPKEQRVMVVKEDPTNPEQFIPLNANTKHKKARYQNERSAKVLLPGPLHISNVMVLDPKTNTPTRVGRKLEKGKLVRVAKKSGQVIPDADVMAKD